MRQRTRKGEFKLKINPKGITPETVTGVILLLIALLDVVLQRFGIRTLPIENDAIADMVSTLFLIATTLYNTWKNRNISSASQIAQNITDAIKQGELLEEDIRKYIETIQHK